MVLTDLGVCKANGDRLVGVYGIRYPV